MTTRELLVFCDSGFDIMDMIETTIEKAKRTHEMIAYMLKLYLEDLKETEDDDIERKQKMLMRCCNSLTKFILDEYYDLFTGSNYWENYNKVFRSYSYERTEYDVCYDLGVKLMYKKICYLDDDCQWSDLIHLDTLGKLYPAKEIFVRSGTLLEIIYFTKREIKYNYQYKYEFVKERRLALLDSLLNLALTGLTARPNGPLHKDMEIIDMKINAIIEKLKEEKYIAYSSSLYNIKMHIDLDYLIE